LVLNLHRSAWLARHILPHEPALRAWLRRRVTPGLEVDDVVHETYAALAALPSVDHIESPRGYAFQTAQSLVLRHMRRAKVVRFEALAPEDSWAHPSDEPTPERTVAAREELQRVMRLIDTMPAKCREAFMLRRFSGLSQRDVARRMGISESTVEKHIGRALRILMDALKDGGNLPSHAFSSAERRDLTRHAVTRKQQGY
jgi:RNA polymerase sigma-70 factor (ECF subfamily)